MQTLSKTPDSIESAKAVVELAFVYMDMCKVDDVDQKSNPGNREWLTSQIKVLLLNLAEHIHEFTLTELARLLREVFCVINHHEEITSDFTDMRIAKIRESLGMTTIRCFCCPNGWHEEDEALEN